MNKHRGPIWKPSREELVEIIENSDSIQHALSQLGVPIAGGNHRTLHKRCEIEGIDLIPLREKGLRRASFAVASFSRGRRAPLSDILVEHSTYSRVYLKKRLVQEGLLEEKCAECGQGSRWRGKRLSLVLDHVNGINDDNRIKNLRFLCPNCNSQTETFAGRNVQGARKKVLECLDCGSPISGNGKTGRCHSCASLKSDRKESRKVKDRPSPEDLRSMIQEMTLVAIGEKYGVSATSVRRLARGYGLTGKRNSASEV